jgi:hypothetical protein
MRKPLAKSVIAFPVHLPVFESTVPTEIRPALDRHPAQPSETCCTSVYVKVLFKQAMSAPCSRVRWACTPRQAVRDRLVHLQDAVLTIRTPVRLLYVKPDVQCGYLELRSQNMPAQAFHECPMSYRLVTRRAPENQACRPASTGSQQPSRLNTTKQDRLLIAGT